MLSRLIRWVMVAAMSASAMTGFAYERNIYVDTAGDDGRSGYSVAESVLTLQRAIDIGESERIAGLTKVNILVAAGVYRRQHAIAKGNSLGAVIEVMPVSVDLRPVFHGDGDGGTWLTLLPRGGVSSRFHITGLEVNSYETAIDLKGNRNSADGWVGGVEVRGNVFELIGGMAKAGGEPSTAAIRLVNARENIIQGNKFSNIRNWDRCVLLHSIYIAHKSSSNMIRDNIFVDTCGDSIRFRDGSNGNVVAGNKFINAWARSPVSDWFCNTAMRDDCTKSSGECPSGNIVLDGNQVVATDAKVVPMFIRYGGVPSSKCAPAGDVIQRN
jgi:hypothetical protein